MKDRLPGLKSETWATRGEKHGGLWCFAHSLGFVETKKEAAAEQAAIAQLRKWYKDHPGQVPPGTPIQAGIIFSPIGAIGAAGGALAEGSALTVPAYASSAGGFVNWLKNLASSGTKLTAEEADAIIAKGDQLGVKVRLDPPHPGTNWEVPHLNVGEEGQVHLEVPQNYSNPNVSLGSATKP